jgi:hypothetical protein
MLHARRWALGQAVPQKENRDAEQSASLFYRTKLISRFDPLSAHCSVIREMQVIAAITVEVDPTLDHITMARIDTHC